VQSRNSIENEIFDVMRRMGASIKIMTFFCLFICVFVCDYLPGPLKNCDNLNINHFPNSRQGESGVGGGGSVGGSLSGGSGGSGKAWPLAAAAEAAATVTIVTTTTTNLKAAGAAKPAKATPLSPSSLHPSLWLNALPLTPARSHFLLHSLSLSLTFTSTLALARSHIKESTHIIFTLMII
jgi:hypothetical protein